MRDGDEGLEALMVHKSRGQAYGGMWVFPGGRVEPADTDPDPHDDELAAARRAAVREAAEETGLVLDADALVPFSHWTPPGHRGRRYLTWFFLAPAAAAVITVDGGEIVDHAWISPSTALARHAAGEIELVPPTWVTLHTLAMYATVADALAAAAGAEPFRYATRWKDVDGGAIALWHGDAGYDSGDTDAAGSRHRLVMQGTTWRYERT